MCARKGARSRHAAGVLQREPEMNGPVARRAMHREEISRAGEIALQPDRKFKPQFTPKWYALHPLSSSTTLCSTQPTINYSTKTAFLW